MEPFVAMTEGVPSGSVQSWPIHGAREEVMVVPMEPFRLGSGWTVRILSVRLMVATGEVRVRSSVHVPSTVGMPLKVCDSVDQVIPGGRSPVTAARAAPSESAME